MSAPFSLPARDTLILHRAETELSMLSLQDELHARQDRIRPLLTAIADASLDQQNAYKTLVHHEAQLAYAEREIEEITSRIEILEHGKRSEYVAAVNEVEHIKYEIAKVDKLLEGIPEAYSQYIDFQFKRQCENASEELSARLESAQSNLDDQQLFRLEAELATTRENRDRHADLVEKLKMRHEVMKEAMVKAIAAYEADRVEHREEDEKSTANLGRLLHVLKQVNGQLGGEERVQTLALAPAPRKRGNLLRVRIALPEA